jgi:opacity protein-like surface antigen
MKRLIATAVTAGAVLMVPAVADAATQPKTCGPFWVRIDGGWEAKVRAASWNTAFDVHRNMSCYEIRRETQYAIDEYRPPGQRGWTYWRSGRRSDGRRWDQYYGGHGLTLRICWLNKARRP